MSNSLVCEYLDIIELEDNTISTKKPRTSNINWLESYLDFFGMDKLIILKT